MTRHILGFVRSEICLLKLWTHEMILAATDIFMDEGSWLRDRPRVTESLITIYLGETSSKHTVVTDINEPSRA